MQEGKASSQIAETGVSPSFFSLFIGLIMLCLDTSEIRPTFGYSREEWRNCSVCCKSIFVIFGVQSQSQEPLSFQAVRNGNFAVVKSLVRRGACCSYKNRRGQTVMDLVQEALLACPESGSMKNIESFLKEFHKK